MTVPTPPSGARRIPKPALASTSADGGPATIRLNKRMAELGLCSRREADDWIARGWVRVDGQPAVMGQPVAANARIEVAREAEQYQRQQVTILINKPVGYVSGQAEDGHEPAVVLVQPQNRWRECNSRMRWGPEQLRGLAPAGRYPLGAAVTPDGAVGLVGNCLDGTVSFLDLALATRIADVPLGGCVAQIAVNAAGTRAAVAHGDRTAILDVASRAVLSDVVTGKGAHGVWMGPAADGGTFAYVTHKYDDHVAVVDVATGAHLGDVPLVHATTGRAALVGATDTGGQGVVVRLP